MGGVMVFFVAWGWGDGSVYIRGLAMCAFSAEGGWPGNPRPAELSKKHKSQNNRNPISSKLYESNHPLAQ
jgi:hypothetical protein